MWLDGIAKNSMGRGESRGGSHLSPLFHFQGTAPLAAIYDAPQRIFGQKGGYDVLTFYSSLLWKTGRYCLRRIEAKSLYISHSEQSRPGPICSEGSPLRSNSGPYPKPLWGPVFQECKATKQNVVCGDSKVVVVASPKVKGNMCHVSYSASFFSSRLH